MSHLTWPTSLLHSPSDESKIPFKLSFKLKAATKNNKGKQTKSIQMEQNEITLGQHTSDGSKFLYALKWQKEIEEISVKKGLSYIDIMHGGNPFYLYILEKVHRKIIIISTYYSGKYKKKRKYKKKQKWISRRQRVVETLLTQPATKAARKGYHTPNQPLLSLLPFFYLPPSHPRFSLCLASLSPPPDPT